MREQDPYAPPRSKRRDDWTDEDFRLVALFGACLVCGEPRKSELRIEGETATWAVTCLNGHDA